MFTGIVSDIGAVRAVRDQNGGDRRFEITTVHDTATIALGASISCAGCCLTVVETGADWFAVEASGETLSKTTLGGWKEGSRINLERALKAGDELGGHIVSGHVDGTAVLTRRAPEGGSLRLGFEAPATLARFIASKGSVTLDGVSLTVNDVEGGRFGVNIISHTAEVTTLGGLEEGAAVNLEIDVFARYVARLMDSGTTEP